MKVRSAKWIYVGVLVGVMVESAAIGMYFGRVENPMQYKSFFQAIATINRFFYLAATAWCGKKVGFSEQKAWGLAFVVFLLPMPLVFIPVAVYILMQKQKTSVSLSIES